MIEITETEALNRVAAYCSTAEHCRAEIAEKLQRWGIAYDAIDRIINRLEQEKYIDEERFCRAFINDKYRFAKWGKMKIGQALQLKKISSSVSTWNVVAEGVSTELLQMNGDGTAQMYLPNGEAMNVTLDAQGVAAARQATMINTYYAAR